MARRVRGDVEQSAQQLMEELELDDRGVLAFVIGPSARVEALVAALPAGAAHLRTPYGTLNAQRDSLLEPNTVQLVAFESADEAARFSRSTPDLTDWVSIVVELQPTPPQGEEALGGELDTYLRDTLDQHATLNLTGLLPGFAQPWKIPIERIYRPLVEPPDEGHVLVLGHPGTGKSTFIRHAACELAKQGLDKDRAARLPVVIPAARYAEACRQRLRSLPAFVVEELERAGVAHAEALIAWVNRSPGGQVVALVDGLDEVSDSQLEMVVRALAEAAESGTLRVVATCRAALAGRVERRLASFHAISPRGLGYDDIQGFVESFVDCHRHSTGGDAIASKKSARRLVGALTGQPELQALASNPLTLTFLTLLHVVEGTLPRRRVELYHRLGQLLIERWNRARSLAGARRSLAYGEAIRTFAPLAWWMRAHAPSGALPERELITRLVEQQSQRGESESVARENAEAFLSSLRKDMLLLLPSGEQWMFFHPTVAEYFAGVELARNRALREQVVAQRRLFEPGLREPLLFALGECGVIRADDDVMAALVDATLEQSRRPGRYDARYAALLGAILLEDVGLDPPRAQALLRRCIDFWFDYKYAQWARAQVDREAGMVCVVALRPPLRGVLEDALAERLVRRDPSALVRRLTARPMPLYELVSAANQVGRLGALSRADGLDPVFLLVYTRSLVVALPSLLRSLDLSPQRYLDALAGVGRPDCDAIGLLARSLLVPLPELHPPGDSSPREVRLVWDALAEAHRRVSDPSPGPWAAPARRAARPDAPASGKRKQRALQAGGT